jgi:hypothetical protein
MKTIRQLSALQSTVHIAPAAHYFNLDAAGRRAFVEHELELCNHPEVESLAIPDLLYLGNAMDSGIPDFFLYRILLGRQDPSAVANYLGSEVDHLLFIDAFGFKRAMPHNTVEYWLELYCLMEIFSDFEGTTKKQISLLLESHGAETVAAVVKAPILCESFVEIFGMNATNLVQKEIVNVFKGRRLEDQLGL